MHAKYEVAIFNIAKVMSKVKVLGQNDRQAKNNIPTIIRSGGIKMGVTALLTEIFLFKNPYRLCRLCQIS